MRVSWFSVLLIGVSLAGPAPAISFTARTIDAGNSGDNKALADIDGDGKQDPILGGSSLSWYEAGRNFAKRVIRAKPLKGEFTTDMQAVDIDGDGDNDIITGDGNSAPNVFWYENPRRRPPPGRGSDPRQARNWVVHPIGYHGDWAHDIEVRDLDRDGRRDVVTGGHGHTHVWKQTLPKVSWKHADLSALNGKGVFLADIDRDGDQDIVVPGGWLENPGDVIRGRWVKRSINRPFRDEVFAADFNRDGRIDIGTCDAHSAANVLWYEAPANPKRSDWRQRRMGSGGAHHPEPADFNGDGWPDLLLGRELADLSILLNNRNGTFTRLRLDTRAGHNARAGDINGDGRMDVFACDYIGHPPVRIYLNRGNTP
jgi:hypothetical protein